MQEAHSMKFISRNLVHRISQLAARSSRSFIKYNNISSYYLWVRWPVANGQRPAAGAYALFIVNHHWPLFHPVVGSSTFFNFYRKSYTMQNRYGYSVAAVLRGTCHYYIAERIESRCAKPFLQMIYIII